MFSISPQLPAIPACLCLKTGSFSMFSSLSQQGHALPYNKMLSMWGSTEVPFNPGPALLRQAVCLEFGLFLFVLAFLPLISILGLEWKFIALPPVITEE